MHSPSPGKPASSALITARAGCSRPGLPAILLLAGVLTCLAGCGYTVLENPNQRKPAARTSETAPGAGDRSAAATDLDLPPGHPPIDEADTWLGRSFLDAIVGDHEPFRFENVRQMRHISLPGEHAQLTLRLHVGSSAVADVWQIRVDEFGWMTVSRWMQGASGPELDESLASQRIEFRLDRASEAALRIMILGLLPDMQSRRDFPFLNFHGLERGLWHYQDSGMLSLDYRIEALERMEDDWPGGTLKGPLDLIQLLIGTWDSRPPEELQALIRHTAQEFPALIPVAMLAEALVLVWEVEGKEQEWIELPLVVGR